MVALVVKVLHQRSRGREVIQLVSKPSVVLPELLAVAENCLVAQSMDVPEEGHHQIGRRSAVVLLSR